MIDIIRVQKMTTYVQHETQNSIEFGTIPEVFFHEPLFPFIRAFANR